MKTRQGFVSNSSSSSFIVGMRNGLSDDEAQKRVLNMLGVSCESLLFQFARDIAYTLVEVWDYEYASEEEFFEENYDEDDDYETNDSFEEEYREELAILRRGWKLHIGSVGNEGEEIDELWLFNNAFRYEDKDMIIINTAEF